VVSELDAQTHRRFIKTHTPLDGLPVDPSVTYLCVGRDPRDVALSMDNHMDNLDIPEFLRLRAEAARLDGIELEPLPAPPAWSRRRPGGIPPASSTRAPAVSGVNC
jgi:aryl sulfotransferase